MKNEQITIHKKSTRGKERGTYLPRLTLYLNEKDGH